MKKIKLHSISTFLICSVSSLFIVSAQSVDLDTTFDSDGKVNTDIYIADTFNLYDEGIRSIVLQPDGKIVAAGYALQGSTNKFGLARYNTDGSLDNSFNSDGRLYTNISTGSEEAYSVALQSDGKIVAAGYSNSSLKINFALIRYTATGIEDNTFSSDGIDTFSVSANDDVATCMAIQPDGMILLAGYSGQYDLQDFIGDDMNDFAIARYNPLTNALDPSFAGGSVVTPISTDVDQIMAIAIQPDGKIVVAGYAYVGSNTDFALARYNANGSLDNTFGSAGIRTTAIGNGNDIIKSIVIQSDGKIIVAGNSHNGSNYDVAVARYTTSGNLDNSFDSDGIQITPIGVGNDMGSSVGLNANGKIIVGGYSEEQNGPNLLYHLALVCYNTDGTLYNPFGTSGKLITPLTSPNKHEKARAIAIQPDGKIIIAGHNENGNTIEEDFFLARYIVPADLGMDDFQNDYMNISLYPNPVLQNVSLSYTLQDDETISTYLVGMHGEIIATLINNEQRESGKNIENLILPEGLEPGTYFMHIVSSKGYTGSLKIIK